MQFSASFCVLAICRVRRIRFMKLIWLQVLSFADAEALEFASTLLTPLGNKFLVVFRFLHVALVGQGMMHCYFHEAVVGACLRQPVPRLQSTRIVLRAWWKSGLLIILMLIVVLGRQTPIVCCGQVDGSLPGNSTSQLSIRACDFPALSNETTNTSMLYLLANGSDGLTLSDILYSRVDEDLHGASRPDFLFCLIQKNAHTSFRRLFMRITLSQQEWEAYRDREKMSYGHLHISDQRLWKRLTLHMRLISGNMSISQVATLLRPGTVPGVVMTRNPYIRLLSGFLDREPTYSFLANYSYPQFQPDDPRTDTRLKVRDACVQ